MSRWIDHARAVLTGAVIVTAAIVALGISAVAQRPQTPTDHLPQSRLRNALTAARTLYTDEQTYRDATPEALTRVEPSVRFGSRDQADKTTVGVAATDQTIYFVTQDPNRDHHWYCLFEDDRRSPAMTTYGQGPTVDSVTPSRCAHPSW